MAGWGSLHVEFIHFTPHRKKGDERLLLNINYDYYFGIRNTKKKSDHRD